MNTPFLNYAEVTAPERTPGFRIDEWYTGFFVKTISELTLFKDWTQELPLIDFTKLFQLLIRPWVAVERVVFDDT